MKKLLILFSLLIAGACSPKEYLGPLDSPQGNWKGQSSKYYFDGNEVLQNTECTYSAISFYPDSLCCIEGLKGAFEWTYSSDSLVVDTTVWKVVELSGARMVLDYLGIIETSKSEDSEATPSPATETGNEGLPETGTESIAPEPVEYNGKIIHTENGKSYWYTGTSGEKVPCWPVKTPSEDGTVTISCWWDTRTDTYQPF